MDVKVLGESFLVRTDPGQAGRRLQGAAALLNERIESIARATRELSPLRLAVMAGLDLAADLLAAREAHEKDLAAEVSFRSSVRKRSDRLLELVRAELRDRHSVSVAPSGPKTGKNRGSASKEC